MGLLRGLETVPVDKRRRRQVDAPLTPRELKQLRAIIGKVAWPARETCRQLAFMSSELQQNIGSANVGHLLKGNLLIKRARRSVKNAHALHFGRLNLDTACVVSMSDASFGNMPRGVSQGGWMCFLADQAVATKDGIEAPLGWKSHRLKRAVKSTLAAESAALAEAQDFQEYARVVFMYMMGRADLNQPWTRA